MWKIAPSVLLLSMLSAPLAHADSASSAEDVIRTTTAQVVERLEANPELSESPDRLYEMVEDVVLPRFDFNRISRRVLGKYWKRASPEQRQRFVEEFQTLLVKTYAIALASYDYVDIVYGASKMRGEEETSVRTEIARGAGAGIPIRYELHQMNGNWKVYDVVVDGVSLSLTYRNDFRSQVRRDGIDALIARIEAHNHEAR